MCGVLFAFLRRLSPFTELLSTIGFMYRPTTLWRSTIGTRKDKQPRSQGLSSSRPLERERAGRRETPGTRLEDKPAVKSDSVKGRFKRHRKANI